MREVDVETTPLDRLTPLLGEERAALLRDKARSANGLFEGLTVWNVNATATGGGVAEMLGTLLAYTRSAGVDTRWLVLDGTPEFFGITKRLHNLLHGAAGDGGSLGEAEHRVYDEVLAGNLDSLLERVSPGDLVILHDPQTAGLAAGLRKAGAHVVWRCHVGRDVPNELSERGWEFLRPYIGAAEASIFSRAVYAPSWLDASTVRVIPPSLDPFSPKNVALLAADVDASLRQAGLVQRPEHGSPTFSRRDGTNGTVRSHDSLFAAGGPVPGDARVVMQVSRWDRLKDMEGVLTSFVDHLDQLPPDAHLLLVGPEVAGVGDDPEGAEVLEECRARWRALPEPGRQRTHLVALPMDDAEENAHLVNALQHYATVVVQKSLVEGFGLTVTEPMWKGRPVVASKVGGIQDQIVHGRSGLLIDDPCDLDGFAGLVRQVLEDPVLAAGLGAEARERVRTEYLGDRHLLQYVDLFSELLG